MKAQHMRALSALVHSYTADVSNRAASSTFDRELMVTQEGLSYLRYTLLTICTMIEIQFINQSTILASTIISPKYLRFLVHHQYKQQKHRISHDVFVIHMQVLM